MLKRGGENPKKIKMLIMLTRIKSESLVQALVVYYVFGEATYPQATIGNFNRAIRKIEEVNDIVEQLKELDK